MRLNDAVIGALLIAFAAVMIRHTGTFPSFPGQKYGPALFPTLIGLGFIGTGAILIWRGVRERAGTPWIEFAPWTREAHRLGGFVLVLAAIVAYILVSDAIGFLLISFVILTVLMAWLGEAIWRATVIALAMTLLIDWFFGDLMRVPLPRGLLNLLSA
jgi:putative tricarboxylic transport membrane protein